MRRFICLTTVLLLLCGVTAAQEKEPETATEYVNRGLAELNKGLDAAAEQDFRKALEISRSLKTMIDTESNKIMQKRKARQQH